MLLLLFGMCPICVLKVGFPVQGEREKQCLFKMLLRLKKKKKTVRIDNPVLLAPILKPFLMSPRRGLLFLFRKEAVSSLFLRIKHHESRCQVPQSYPLSAVLESTWFKNPSWPFPTQKDVWKMVSTFCTLMELKVYFFHHDVSTRPG